MLQIKLFKKRLLFSHTTFDVKQISCIAHFKDHTGTITKVLDTFIK